MANVKISETGSLTAFPAATSYLEGETAGGTSEHYPVSGLRKVVQVVHTQTGEMATGMTTTDADDTIPQNNQGDQYMSLAITPTNASNKLLIEVIWIGSSNAVVLFALALHQDSVADALAVVAAQPTGASSLTAIPLRHEMTAGTTSPTTFKVRVGGNNAGTTTFNGISGVRYYGGALVSSIRITEFQA